MIRLQMFVGPFNQTDLLQQTQAILDYTVGIHIESSKLNTMTLKFVIYMCQF